MTFFSPADIGHGAGEFSAAATMVLVSKKIICTHHRVGTTAFLKLVLTNL